MAFSFDLFKIIYITKIFIPTGGKNRFTLLHTQNIVFILVLLFIKDCIIFHKNSCKSAFALYRMEPPGGLK